MRIKITISILGFLIISEVLLRIFYTPAEFNPQFNRNWLLWMNKYVYLNSAGYRDREYQFFPSKDTYRIYVVGNSYTFGWGINSLQDTYPKVIETMLAKNTQRKVEVINAGQPGFHLRDDVLRFETEGIHFHPNLVLIGLNFNDANINNQYYARADEVLPKFITSLRLYHLFIGRFFEAIADKMNNDYYLSIYKNPDSPDWQTAEKLLLELKREAGKINTQVAILIFPHLNMQHPNAPFNFTVYNKRYREFAEKNNILLIDPYSLYEKYPHKEDLEINPVDEHPSVTMDHMAAQAFVQQIDTARLFASSQATPSAQTVTLDSNHTGLENYSMIDSISSKSSLPWLYFDALSSSTENYPLYDTSSQQTFIYPDRIRVTKDQPAEVLYQLYPDTPGKLIIPDKVYGYQVIGIKALKGIAFSSETSMPIVPSSVKQQGDNFIVSYNPRSDVYIAQAELLIAANTLVINPVTHKIAGITTVQTVKQKVTEDKNFLLINSKDRIVAIPQIQNTNILKNALKNIVVTLSQITHISIFNLTDYSGNIKPTAKKLIQLPILQSRTSYAFVDGVLTQVHVDEINPYQIKLSFDRTIKKGQTVEFSFITDYPLQDNPVIVTTEKSSKQ